MKKTLTLLICLICYQILCHAQVADEHYYFKNLSVQNGLSQNTCLLYTSDAADD